MSASAMSELFPELFHVISGHLPLVHRPSTLLSLALTCHRLHDVVIPHLLYENVRLVGEDQALPTLNTLIAKVGLVNEEEDKWNPSPSHYIHHLCIDSSIKSPIPTPDNSIDALQNLVDAGGLQHLLALTLHVTERWDEPGEEPLDIYLTLPLSFLESLRTNCPHLKSVYFTDFSHEFGSNSIDPPGLFSIKSLTRIRIEGHLYQYPIPTIDFSQLSPNLHTLELHLQVLDLDQGRQIDASGPGGLFNCVFPNLNTLILDHFTVSDPTSANRFWRLHPGIQRLEFGHCVTGSWFNNFEIGMLPNLRYLQCHVRHALVILPQASKTLIRLSLLETCDTQGPYLLRVIVPGGVLPALRSLSIHRDSGDSPESQEGRRWREDENGGVSQIDATNTSRQFDGNYIMSISKAAPNLEELELIGTSDDTLDSITASLSLFPKLQRLSLSGGGIDVYETPFFARSLNWADYAEFNLGCIPEKSYGKYAPESFNEAARDLADGCRTLDVVTIGNNVIGDLLIHDGLSARIVREREGGAVKEIKRIRAWGNIIGKEEEW